MIWKIPIGNAFREGNAEIGSSCKGQTNHLVLWLYYRRLRSCLIFRVYLCRFKWGFSPCFSCSTCQSYRLDGNFFSPSYFSPFSSNGLSRHLLSFGTFQERLFFLCYGAMLAEKLKMCASSVFFCHFPMKKVKVWCLFTPLVAGLCMC